MMIRVNAPFVVCGYMMYVIAIMCVDMDAGDDGEVVVGKSEG